MESPQRYDLIEAIKVQYYWATSLNIQIFGVKQLEFQTQFYMSKLVKVELDLEKQLLHENQFSEALAFQKITLDSISIPREFDYTARVKDNYMLIEAPAFLGDPDSD